MVQAPEPDCWLHPDVEVRPSSLAGMGLFATGDIRVGTTVSRLGGRLVTSAELRVLLSEAAHNPELPYIDTITVAEGVELVLPPRRPNGYGNHSCDPNLWWTDSYTLAARRHIAAGEELTNDYGTSTGHADFQMECICRAEVCRGVVTGDDWRRPELRERYGAHWIPALAERLAT